MSKGKALLGVRRILGPSGHVRFHAGLPEPCIVGTFAERWRGLACGRTWKEAIAELRKVKRAA